ncbi:hypothetical protein TNCV_366201 [Trichonephila clavipes]|nr:hypothetical protein TNCV_366201 [Trichonephila clavipes]
MHEQQKDCIAKGTVGEMYQTAKCLIICIAVCVNTDHYENRHTESGPRVTRTPSMEQNVLDTVLRNSSTSIRLIAAAVGGTRGSVHRVLTHEDFHPYHLQRFVSLLPTDYPARVRFARLYLDRFRKEAHLPSYAIHLRRFTFDDRS